jgi:hypothetical protein
MYDSDKKFTFPFDTCEKPNKTGFAQPWSTLVNILMCIMIFYYFLNSNTFYSGLFLISILCFELVHAFSHAIHIPGLIQHYLTHLFGIFTMLSFALMLYNYTSVLPDLQYLIIIFIIVIADIYILLKNFGFIYNLLTYFMIFLLTLWIYYPYMSASIKRNLLYIAGLVIIIYMIEYNELMNCNWMMERFQFPYHIFVETTGFVAVYLLCSTFYKI